MRRQIVALSFATLVTSLIIGWFSIYSRSRHCWHVPFRTYLPLHRSYPLRVFCAVQPPVLSLYSLKSLHWLRPFFQNSKIPFAPCEALKRRRLPYSESCRQSVRKSLILLRGFFPLSRHRSSIKVHRHTRVDIRTRVRAQGTSYSDVGWGFEISCPHRHP